MSKHSDTQLPAAKTNMSRTPSSPQQQRITCIRLRRPRNKILKNLHPTSSTSQQNTGMKIWQINPGDVSGKQIKSKMATKYAGNVSKSQRRDQTKEGCSHQESSVKYGSDSSSSDGHSRSSESSPSSPESWPSADSSGPSLLLSSVQRIWGRLWSHMTTPICAS